MKKKHFILLADDLRRIKPADFCQKHNPAFKRQRWFDYIDGKCGPNGGKINANKAISGRSS
jgi:hypothetical protein